MARQTSDMDHSHVWGRKVKDDIEMAKTQRRYAENYDFELSALNSLADISKTKNNKQT